MRPEVKRAPPSSGMLAPFYEAVSTKVISKLENTYQVCTSSRTDVDHNTSNILRLTKTTQWVRLLQLLGSTEDLDQAVCQLTWEETWLDNVGSDTFWTQLVGQVAAEVRRSGLGDGVHDGAVGAGSWNGNAGDGGDNDDAGWVTLGRCLGQERREPRQLVSHLTQRAGEDLLLRQQKDTTNVQIQNLLARLIWSILKSASPRSTSVRNEDIQLSVLLLDPSSQALDIVLLSAVGGNADGLALDARNGIQLVDGLVNAILSAVTASRDDDCRCAGLEEASRGVKTNASGAAGDEGDLAVEAEEVIEVLDLRHRDRLAIMK